MVLHIPRHPQLKEINMSIPLMIRLLEYSREDAKTDMDLHNVAERAEQMGKKLSMKDYDKLVGRKHLKGGILADIEMDEPDVLRETIGSMEELIQSLTEAMDWLENYTGLDFTDMIDIISLIYRAIHAEDMKSKIKLGRDATIKAVYGGVRIYLASTGILSNKYIRFFVKLVVTYIVGWVYDELVGTGEEEEGKGFEKEINLSKIKNVLEDTKQKTLDGIIELAEYK